MQITIDDRQHATIIAALRFYQKEGISEPTKPSGAIYEIATNYDTVIALDEQSIDELCELLNFGP